MTSVIKFISGTSWSSNSISTRAAGFGLVSSCAPVAVLRCRAISASGSGAPLDNLFDTDKWFQRKGYIHFDPPLPLVGKRRQQLIAYVTNPDKVARHSFYPFIERPIIQRRFKNSPAGRRINLKVRPVCYAAHLDSAIFKYYSMLLSDRYEEALSSNCKQQVLAYRPNLGSNIDFALQAFGCVRHLGPCVALCFDLSNFFGTLRHADLKEQWCQLLGQERLPVDHFALFKAMTRYATVRYEELISTLGVKPKQIRDREISRFCEPAVFRNTIRKSKLIRKNEEAFGIVQGSAISATLSNLYMRPFDEKLQGKVAAWGGASFRYSDDLLLIIPPEFEEEAQGYVAAALEGLGLQLNQEKTERSFFVKSPDGALTVDRKLGYLGFEFDGEQVLIRSKTIAKFHHRLTARRNSLLHRNSKSPGFSSPKKKLYSRFSHLGSRNFLSYAKRAHIKTEKAGFRSGIRKQCRKCWPALQRALKAIDEPQ